MFRRMSYMSLVSLIAAGSLVLSASSAAGAAGRSNDALTAARFSITVDGHSLGSWSKVQGLDVSWSRRTVVIGRATATSTSAGRSIEMWASHEAARAGRLRAAKHVVIHVYGADRTSVTRYHLESAWPAKVELGLTSRGSRQSYESVILVCEDIHRVSP